MNLRNVDEYNIGLDIGTGSVGWAVTDVQGNLCHFKGKPTWGSRIFPNAVSAAEARAHRGQRRRYTRRRWRLELLQELFAQEVEKVDPEFFIRMNQSRLLPQDRADGHDDYVWTLFNDDEFNERDYFKSFPTIYHLRKWLMETDEQADIRLIYLAFHNIVKHRGNFLQQDTPGLTSASASVEGSTGEFCFQLQEYCDVLGIPCEVMDGKEDILNVLEDTNSARADLKDRLKALFAIRPVDGVLDKKAVAAMATALASGIIGLSSELANVFFLTEEKPEGAKTKIYLSKDEDVEAFAEICPDEALPLFEAMNKVYSAFVLQEILSSRPGESISINKVSDYEQYGKDLKLLKSLVRQYAPQSYDEFFRGSFYAPTVLHPQKNVYDKAKAAGYTKYNVDHGYAYDDFKKDVAKLLGGTGAAEDSRYLDMMERFDNKRFLRRLKTSDNGAIPFQLHLEEMDRIIEKQARFYPFLRDEKEKLDSLVTFRIPYYVGPLTKKNACVDAKGKMRFAWSERLEGKEKAQIKPWNWEEIIDKDRSATAFIQRMTGTCTYLQGEPVLPKCSLLYEEFCVLNELNGAHFSQDGDREYRFDYADRSDMVKELFTRGKVSYKKAADWMRQRGNSAVRVSGGQGETGFESKLGSYIFFAKDVLEVDEIPQSDYPMIEEIILWNTIFEDRAILRDKIKRNYGDRLTDEQISKIVRKRFAGWGRLSKKLLCELKVNTDSGLRSIMDVMREGDPNGSSPSRAVVFMEVIRDDRLGFDELILEHNKQTIDGATGVMLEELPGSPALRRAINQALGIVEEIVHIAGHAPENIFVEVTRDEDVKKKGKRTKRRYDNLIDAMKALKKESPEIWDSNISAQLNERSKSSADLDEKLTLYFMQNGKSLYSGTPLDIGRLSDYQVDHIIPQSYVKDDSLENKALVLASENQSKSDEMLLPSDMRKKMRSYWKALLQAGLIGEKKYNNLMRDHISDGKMKGFIARQLVETSQIVKLVQGFLEERYASTRVVPVKAALSHELRERIGLVKCREINDFHHAHDALLASEIGRFVLKRHAQMYDNPIGYAHVMRDYVKNESKALKRGDAPGTSSFVISSFMTPGFDEETGEFFKDDWAAGAEIAKLKRCFDYRQCFISRMPEETDGAFWKQTIYSPRKTGKNMTLPLKKGLDPEKYGSYTEEKYAFFFIYRAKKKEDEVLEFAPVPVSVAASTKTRANALEEYAQGLAQASGFEFVDVVRPKIYKYQLIEIGDSRLYLTGREEVRNAVQFAFDRQETAVAKAMYDGTCVQTNELDELFICVVESLTKRSPLLSRRIGIDSWKDEFFSLTAGERTNTIKGLIAIGNGKYNSIDLTQFGKAKTAGQLKVRFSRLLSKDDGFVIVDQSITGMFERRTHVGL